MGYLPSLNLHFQNIDTGYDFDEASLVRARNQEATERAKRGQLLIEVVQAGRERAEASSTLNQAKQYQFDRNDTIRRVYLYAEDAFSEANDAYWKLHTAERLSEIRIDHWQNVIIQIEDKVAEAQFTKVRDEALKLRVQVQSLHMQKKETERLVAELLK